MLAPMTEMSRLRKPAEALSGDGLMQSKAEWNLRNEVLSQTLCDLVDRFRPVNATSGLDVGAQDGSLTDRYAELTKLEWTGIDPAFESEQRSPAGAILLPGTASELPFADATFGVVMLANVYEHIMPEQRVSSMVEMRRVLGPRGVIVGQIPNPYFVIENHSRLPFMGYLPTSLQRHYWRLSRVPWEADFFVVTPRHLTRDATAAGFSVSLVRRFNYPLEVIPGRVRSAARVVVPLTRRFMPWAWQFVLLARD